MTRGWAQWFDASSSSSNDSSAKHPRGNTQMCNYFEIYALFGIVIWRRARYENNQGMRRSEREKDINRTETMKTARNRNSYSYGYFKYFSRILKVSVSANSLYLYLYGYLVVSVFCILWVSACESERVCLHIMGRILFSFSFLCLLSTLLSVLVPIPFATRFLHH